MTAARNEFSETAQLLQELLLRKHIAGFSTGDVWTLRFVENEYQLAFQNFSCSKESSINEALRGHDMALFDCADPDGIAKAAILSSVTMRKVMSASVDEDAALSLVFEGDIELIFNTDTDVVDWQWCVTKNVPNPYAEEYELACFWKGEVSHRNRT